MKIIVISPEADDARETAVLDELFAVGLDRYHVRKPVWPAARLAAWLRALPAEWYPRIVLHQHHQLVEEFGLGGRHWRDMPGNAGGSTAPFMQGQLAKGPITSRSCHDIATLRAVLDRYDSIFFGPIFPTVSKPGYGPSGSFSPEEISGLLNSRSGPQRRATVLALGGITAETAPRAIALGFDGVAMLGAVWHAADPVKTFTAIQAGVREAWAQRPTNRGEIRSDDAA
jgi:thiamine-phosphate pyrophosphorylase